MTVWGTRTPRSPDTTRSSDLLRRGEGVPCWTYSLKADLYSMLPVSASAGALFCPTVPRAFMGSKAGLASSLASWALASAISSFMVSICFPMDLSSATSSDSADLLASSAFWASFLETTLSRYAFIASP